MEKTSYIKACPCKTPEVMKRYELKYLMDDFQTEFLTDKLKGHMEPDEYGLSSIASLYYDTPDHRLIRESIEKPAYKEKIRLRSYGVATDDSPVYLELKRKADGIVYKRRVTTSIPKAEEFFEGVSDLGPCGQISTELKYFRDYYRTLIPSCLIIYDRIAYYEPGGELRLTIDRRPRYRMDEMDLTGSMEGELLLPEGHSILEIKVQSSVPLWLTQILSEGKIYKSSFSKYGEAYKKESCHNRIGA